MNIERKENGNKCEICEDFGVVHVAVGWKDYSFHCPNCNRKGFLVGIKNVYLTEETAMNLIENFGQAE